MPLLNYTTSISADKTIGEIQKLLVKAGARAILANYRDDGTIDALSFQMPVEAGQLVGFKLPCDPEPVLLILKRDPKVPNRLKDRDQALRVAWRIVKDWVEAQLAIIETRMVKPEQVFLPYAVTQSGETVFERFESGKLLGSGDSPMD
jgi:hypothetical protein